MKGVYASSRYYLTDTIMELCTRWMNGYCASKQSLGSLDNSLALKRMIHSRARLMVLYNRLSGMVFANGELSNWISMLFTTEASVWLYEQLKER